MRTEEEIKQATLKQGWKIDSENYKTVFYTLLAREELPDAYLIILLCTNCGNKWEIICKKYDEIESGYWQGGKWNSIFHKGVLVPIDETKLDHIVCPKCGLEKYIIVHDKKLL